MVRTVMIKTSAGLYKRLAAKLAVLPEDNLDDKKNNIDIYCTVLSTHNFVIFSNVCVSIYRSLHFINNNLLITYSISIDSPSLYQ